MTLSETIELIAKAMEGATPEAWELIVCDDQRPAVVSSGDVICLPDPNHGRDAGLPDKMDMANFAYISACSPDRMREVLAAAREADVLKREIAELHTVLAMVRACYFIGRPDCANEFVRSTWELVHTADDARALLSKESDDAAGSSLKSSGAGGGE